MGTTEVPHGGEREPQANIMLAVTPEAFVSDDHLLRRIKPLVGDCLERLSPCFEGDVRKVGRPSRPSICFVAAVHARGVTPHVARNDRRPSQGHRRAHDAARRVWTQPAASEAGGGFACSWLRPLAGPFTDKVPSRGFRPALPPPTLTARNRRSVSDATVAAELRAWACRDRRNGSDETRGVHEARRPRSCGTHTCVRSPS